MIDPFLDFPGYLLRRASAAALAEIGTRLAVHGLRPTEATILALVANNADVTQSDIGHYLGIQRANMTPIIARLIEQGWLCKKPIDGRSQALFLTDLGASLQKATLAEMQAYEQSLMEKMPDTLRGHLLPVLNALWSRSG